MGQRLRPHLPVQGVKVQSLVEEQTSHIPAGPKSQKGIKSNIVKNTIKTLKMVHR